MEPGEEEVEHTLCSKIDIKEEPILTDPYYQPIEEFGMFYIKEEAVKLEIPEYLDPSLQVKEEKWEIPKYFDTWNASQVEEEELERKAGSTSCSSELQSRHQGDGRKPPSNGGSSRSGGQATDRSRTQATNTTAVFARKKYRCDFGSCDKAYGKSSHLKTHFRTHTGERPFPCTWSCCGKRFARADVLARHTLVHTGEKNFCCPVCGRKFSRSHHLKHHTSRHLNFDPLTSNDIANALQIKGNSTSLQKEMGILPETQA